METIKNKLKDMMSNIKFEIDSNINLQLLEDIDSSKQEQDADLEEKEK